NSSVQAARAAEVSVEITDTENFGTLDFKTVKVKILDGVTVKTAAATPLIIDASEATITREGTGKISLGAATTYVPPKNVEAEVITGGKEATVAASANDITTIAADTTAAIASIKASELSGISGAGNLLVTKTLTVDAATLTISIAKVVVTGEVAITTSSVTLSDKLDLSGATLSASGTTTVTLSDSVTVKATKGNLTLAGSGPLLVPADKTLTVESGTLTVGSTVTVTETGKIVATGTGVYRKEDVKAAYPLSDTDQGTAIGGTATYLQLTAAVKELRSDGVPTLTRTVASQSGQTSPVPTTANWGTAGDGATALGGKFSDLAVDLGAVLTAPTTKTYAIKTTTLGLLYYAGATYLNAGSNTNPNTYFVTNTLITAPQPEDAPDVYINTAKTVAFKWKKYNAGTFSTHKTHGILTWSEADPKEITLDIAEVGGSGTLTPVAKIVIDYDDVDFP
ncbi:MAG: hypothetical protein LBU28_10985, partial [Spirochaetaceae bacterium]|nr:hypothetical protein [Spirochaetaceae bacterium]